MNSLLKTVTRQSTACSRYYTGSGEMQKMGWFGVVRGHSRSSAMSPFDRAHTTSYSTLTEIMCPSFTVVEI